MSRESDNASPRPRGTGGTAYPSGTPPYGTAGANGTGGAAAPRNAGPAPDRPEPGETPKTETTLTTRIRINIPGSRPIPPVVVRSALPGAEGEGAEEARGATAEAARPGGHRHRDTGAPGRVLGVVDDGTGAVPVPELPPEWQTPEVRPAAGPAAARSDDGGWFRPRARQSPAAAAPQSPAPPLPEQPAEQPPAPAAGAFGTPGPAARPSSPASPFPAPPDDAAAESRYPSHGGPSAAFPGHGGPAPAGGRFPTPAAPASPFPPAEETTAQFPAPTGPASPFPPAGPPADQDGLLYERPDGDAFGGPLPSRPVGTPDDPAGRPPVPGAGRRSPAGGARTGAAPEAPGGAGPDAAASLAAPFAPGGASTGAAGANGVTGAGGGLAEPRGSAQRSQAAPFTGFPGVPSMSGAGAPQSGSRRPEPSGAVPAPPPGDGFAGGTGGVGAPPRSEPKKPGAAAPQAEAAAPKAEPPAKPKRRGRGRKLAVYGVTCAVVAGAVAYGAGLMLNQSDIPKGTTVLGTDIGGDSRDAAVAALDGTVGKSSQQPLVLSIGGRTVQLTPATAGLTIDTNATVQALAQHSYNPVTVIESLFSSRHAVDPTVVVDQQKLHAALEQLASSGAGSSVREGSVSFRVDGLGKGSVVTVLPQAGAGLDVSAAAVVVQQAYQQRAQGTSVGTLTLPVGTVQPRATAAEVQHAADTIGKWAVSGRFYVRTAGGTEIAFGSVTFSKALKLVPNGSGALVPSWDDAAVQHLYNGAFNGLKTKSGSPVTVQDITAALTTLLEKPNGPRTVDI